MSRTILIVDDEAPIREMLGFNLKLAGFSFLEAETAAAAKAVIQQQMPDLILLDQMMPGMTGIEFAKQLKQNSHTQNIPIIMLTAKAEEDTKVAGLESGADDYMVKPISPRELIARINAVLRRSSGQASTDVIRIDSITIEIDNHRLLINDEMVKIGPTEFRLLQFLMQHPNRVYNRSQLLDNVWGTSAYLDERTVDVHVRRLRKILEEFNYAHLIETVHGAGYRFLASGEEK